MATGSVVLHFDVLEKDLAQGIGVHQRHTMDALDLQAMEKALHHRIVVAVASAAHTGDQSVATDQVPVIPATVNAAAIRVYDHTARLATPGKRRSQRRAGELSVDARARRPSDHLACAQIQDHREVERALYGPQVGDVTGPLLVRPSSTEVLGKDIGRYTKGVARVGGIPKRFGRGPATPAGAYSQPRSCGSLPCLQPPAPREGEASRSGASSPQTVRPLSRPAWPAQPSVAKRCPDGAAMRSSHCARRRAPRTGARCCGPIDAGVWRRTSVQLLREVRRGFFQDRDLFGLVGELALKPSIFLAELAFAVSDGLLVCCLSPPLIDLRGVQAELTGRGCNTDALGECQRLGTIFRTVADPFALGHVVGCCCHGSPPVY